MVSIHDKPGSGFKVLNPEPHESDIPLQESILRGNITPFSTLLSRVNDVYTGRI
jgi:hypothetical protein